MTFLQIPHNRVILVTHRLHRTQRPSEEKWLQAERLVGLQRINRLRQLHFGLLRHSLSRYGEFNQARAWSIAAWSK
jgi:hypothetical protein